MWEENLFTSYAHLGSKQGSSASKVWIMDRHINDDTWCQIFYTQSQTNSKLRSRSLVLFMLIRTGLSPRMSASFFPHHTQTIQTTPQKNIWFYYYPHLYKQLHKSTIMSGIINKVKEALSSDHHDNTTTTTGSHATHSTNAGPHSSNVANKADRKFNKYPLHLVYSRLTKL